MRTQHGVGARTFQVPLVICFRGYGWRRPSIQLLLGTYPMQFIPLCLPQDSPSVQTILATICFPLSQFTLHSTGSALQPHVCLVFFLPLHFQFFLEFTMLNWYYLFMFVSATRFGAIEWITLVQWNRQNEAYDKITLLPDGASFMRLRQVHG